MKPGMFSHASDDLNFQRSVTQGWGFSDVIESSSI
jgi:hypothetical protein